MALIVTILSLLTNINYAIHVRFWKVRPYASFDAETDAKILRKAMKGLGTDEKAIVDVLCNRSNEQRIQIKMMFKTSYGKDLIKELKSELGGRFEDVVVALMEKPSDYDAICLQKALSGAGTDEDCLIEVMCTRSNAEIQAVKDSYKKLFHRDLEKELMSDTSGHFKRLMVALSAGGRNEAQQLDRAKAERDARALYNAGEKKWGTDESSFNQVLCSQSFDQLRLVFEEYQKMSNKSMEKVIKSEMSGDLKDGMLAIVKSAQNVHAFFAEMLYKSMKGAGTKDNQLIRIVVSRCEVDMVEIKQEFQRAYGKTLESFIQGDCSGDYKKALLALVS
ncbi:hypothetical protein CAPTEDRAFT_226167 [Capitella teleta]|uniref:Annexin n=1 Tax=Capitella teleta TaxID=283909 RepID=R7TCT3_CAPTE|nr:hypothetical protein CAPTEDRAFT_226167 [Capitella teleta]|eukprot:ELT88886.1 hypothetical protein CAPTEDRAFT_226167 [Capitella teleta]